MTIDILALEVLPETEPLALADLDNVGLLPCRGETCWSTCWATCLITDW